MLVPACNNAATLSSTLSFVKYKFDPSDKLPVFGITPVTSDKVNATAPVLPNTLVTGADA